MSENSPPRRNHCQYHRLENGVHEFVLTEASHHAVDDFVDALETMAQSMPPETSAPILIDSTVGMQPTSYIISRTLRMMSRYPSPKQRSRMAIVLQPSFLRNTLAVMLRIFPFILVRFYKPGEREEALVWLTEAEH
jgi:hypothetical protein